MPAGLLTLAVLARGETVVAVVLATLAVLVVGLGVTALLRQRRRPLLRVDATGLTLNPGGRERRGWGRPIPWRDIDAVVCWKAGKGRDGHWVGVAASASFRARHGLDKMRVNQFFDKAVGMPVMGTVTRWQGPVDEIHRLRETVALVAPEIPFVDPHAVRDASQDA
ncbi:hypothetical protein [Streptodolium elevatio]